ncbi:5-oxoprolinase subunit B family protein [Cucumibacter marinus]|uniref:5-oxoprolinase subunit B family protein n=1 Tax=Cucumibacter marinus TaxID=1121252 RepID=UPI000401AA97|nr:carboxyltransferase domain-containing protein [Cucumibacter marinus]
MTVESIGTMPNAILHPLGDAALLVKFGNDVGSGANRAAIGFADILKRARLPGVAEIATSLVSVFVGYDPARVSFQVLSGEIRLRLPGTLPALPDMGEPFPIEVEYGGAGGPDFQAVCDALELTPDELIAAHQTGTPRVLSGGFSPGFVYIGPHEANLTVPRRETLREDVPAGSVLFAAGQTAITATRIRTGWNVIGRTDFRNFDLARTPPVTLMPGRIIQFAGGLA